MKNYRDHNVESNDKRTPKLAQGIQTSLPFPGNMETLRTKFSPKT